VEVARVVVAVAVAVAVDAPATRRVPAQPKAGVANPIPCRPPWAISAATLSCARAEVAAAVRAVAAAVAGPVAVAVAVAVGIEAAVAADDTTSS
jgi:hypothetical protein